MRVPSCRPSVRRDALLWFFWWLRSHSVRSADPLSFSALCSFTAVNAACWSDVQATTSYTLLCHDREQKWGRTVIDDWWSARFKWSHWWPTTLQRHRLTSMFHRQRDDFDVVWWKNNVYKTQVDGGKDEADGDWEAGDRSLTRVEANVIEKGSRRRWQTNGKRQKASEFWGKLQCIVYQILNQEMAWVRGNGNTRKPASRVQLFLNSAGSKEN